MAYSAATKAKIEAHKSAGYNIIEGNSPFLNKAKKYQGREVVRLCQTNGGNGRSVRTVWAVK